MRILIVSPYLPWPLTSGGNAAQFSTLRCLCDDHAFVLVCPVYSLADRDHARVLAESLPRVSVKAVFCGSPPPPLESYPARLLRATRNWIRGKPRSPAPPSAPPLALPWYPFHPLPPPLVEALAAELARRPDLVQCEFAETMPLGAWLPKGMPRVLVHHQIHHVYARRFLEAHGTTPYGDYLVAIMKVQEIAYLRTFDAIVTFSEIDRETLAVDFPIEHIHCSPFPVPVDVGIADAVDPRFDGRFVFVGSETHRPNADALSWLLEEIWPEIAAHLPDATLEVVGEWGDNWSTDRRGGRISFSGFTADLGAALRHAILLVPLRIGSGIRTKILAAWAQGAPVVTTPVGAEGLLAADDREILVREDAPALAAAAVRLAQDSELRRRLAAAGLALVTRCYSPAEVRRRRNEIYRAVVAGCHSLAPSNPLE